MTLLPPAKAVQIRSRTFHAILELSIEHPLLTPEQIAALLGRNLATVMTIMRSDAFLELRASGIIERHGDKIQGLRTSLLDTGAIILEAIQTRLLDPGAQVTLPQMVEAGKFVMGFLMAPAAGASAEDPTKSVVNVFNISAEDMQRARQLQESRARDITLTANRPAVSQQLSGEDRS